MRNALMPRRMYSDPRFDEDMPEEMPPDDMPDPNDQGVPWDEMQNRRGMRNALMPPVHMAQAGPDLAPRRAFDPRAAVEMSRRAYEMTKGDPATDGEMEAVYGPESELELDERNRPIPLFDPRHSINQRMRTRQPTRFR